MLQLRLNPALPGPLHDRIAAAVRHAVADGTLQAGVRLPTARELADELDVNVNTVLRAYRQLAGEGLIDLRRGRGASVSGQPDMARLYELVDELLAEAARLGMARGELAAVLLARS